MMVLSQDGRYYVPFEGTVFEIVPVGKNTLIYAGVPGIITRGRDGSNTISYIMATYSKRRIAEDQMLGLICNVKNFPDGIYQFPDELYVNKSHEVEVTIDA